MSYRNSYPHLTLRLTASWHIRSILESSWALRAVPYRSKKRQRAANLTSAAKYYQAHKAERAAYMRKYRRRKKRERRSAGPEPGAE